MSILHRMGRWWTHPPREIPGLRDNDHEWSKDDGPALCVVRHLAEIAGNGLLLFGMLALLWPILIPVGIGYGIVWIARRIDRRAAKVVQP